MKTCSKCKETKPSTSYYTKKDNKDGLNSECKECCLKRCKKHYEENKEKRRKYSAEYSREHILERKEYNLRNKLRNADRAKKYHEEHSDKINPLRCFRKALKKYPLCDCCSLEVIKIFYLNRPEEHQVDHKLCAKLGGLHCISNLQYLTKEDHIKKGGIERTIFKLMRELVK